MKFKKGDIVYLDKRGLIDWETQDNTICFYKNIAYIVQCSYHDSITILTYMMHQDHFKKFDINNGLLQGDKFFKKGDKVKLDVRGKIGWEPTDYTVKDNIIEDEIYEIGDYHINFEWGKSIMLVNGKGGIHPNHFKKVNND